MRAPVKKSPPPPLGRVELLKILMQDRNMCTGYCRAPAVCTSFLHSLALIMDDGLLLARECHPVWGQVYFGIHSPHPSSLAVTVEHNALAGILKNTALSKLCLEVFWSLRDGYTMALLLWRLAGAALSIRECLREPLGCNQKPLLVHPGNLSCAEMF